MMSSDSDGYEASDSSYRPRVFSNEYRCTKPRRTATGSSSSPDQVKELTSSLRNTTRNLNAVGDLMGHYRDNNERQSAAIERLRDNLAHSTESLKQERLNRASALHGSYGKSSRPLRSSDLEDSRGRRKYKPTSPHDDYYGVNESRRRKGRRLRKPSVHFDEDLDEVHEIHQTVRDLSSDQIRLEDDLDREIQRRTQSEIESKRNLQGLSDSLRESQRKTEKEKSSLRVDKRLQAIQEELRQQRMQQESKQRKAKETTSVSAELKQALATQSKQEEKEMRERLLKAETEKQQLTRQLETTQRKLDKSEGIKTAMQLQMDDYKNNLRVSDHERSIMQDKLSDYQEALEDEGVPLTRRDRMQQRLRDTTDKQDRERQQLEQEIEALKKQLTQSQSEKDLESYQRELKRSQKQQDQLSQHLESVTKELEGKERHIAHLTSKVEDASTDLKRSQHQQNLVLTQLEELKKRLGSADRKVEGQDERLVELQSKLGTSQEKKEEIRTKARDKIRQWKLKCAKLQRDADSFKRSLSKAVSDNEQLLRDTESHRTLNGTSSHRMDILQREMNDILEKRAQQDEQLRLKDIETNELKSVRKDLELELRDTRNFMDKLDNELRAHQARHNVLADEKLRLEEDLQSSRAKHQQAEDHIQKLQAEWNKLNLQQSELTGQLAEESGGRRVAEAHIRHLMQDIKTSKDDAERQAQQLKEEKMSHEVFAEELQKKIDDKKGRGERMVMELTNRLKRERAEMDAELQTLKIEIADAQSQVKTLRRQLEESKTEADKSTVDLARVEQENAKLRRKYERAKLGFEEQARHAETEDSRASNLERQLKRSSTQLLELDAEYESILRIISQEVDHLVEAISDHHGDAYKAVLSPTRDIKNKPQHWLADIKSKLHWLQEEMRTKHANERRLKRDLETSRTDIEEISKYTGQERRELMSQITEQSSAVRELQQDNQDLAMGKIHKDVLVKSLEKQVAQLENHIETNTKTLRRSLEMLPEPEIFSPDVSSHDYKKLKDLQAERDRINDRYNRYTGTVSLLQQQLEQAKNSSFLQSGIHTKRSPKGIRFKSP
ncbi:centrosomal protein of 128 kDa-like isoform X1 [Asterias rubens]|uniref:centrosomal protein of 128 kDa-like isoform X1 n=1 Tax=Asterias rubens TaxID=7604 RepID=UPI001455DB74|nr:centrosomal protein of 128 kDa-like isoform X1 [Asterias rubens]XP_033628055.1 centrosomal protein of 128 kDa-like isoform X1 [Asterias rubens]